MTAEEWKKRAKTYFVEKTKGDDRLAEQVSESCWQLWIENGADEADTPEECVYEELSYWAADAI